MTNRIRWEKQSFKRYAAKIGPLVIDVKLVGVPGDKYWKVGEIFGQHHTSTQRARFTLEQAQIAAVVCARKLLKEACVALCKSTG